MDQRKSWVKKIVKSRQRQLNCAQSNDKMEKVTRTSAWPVRAPMALALEPRFMFDAAGGVTGAQLAEQAATQTITQGSTDSSDTPAQAVEAELSNAPHKEVVVIDAAIENYETLLEGISSDVDVIILQSGSDVHGLAEALSGYDNLDTLHLFTHGTTGAVNFSGGALTLDNLAASQDALVTIGNALSADGDLLLYGCQVGADNAGQDFIAALGDATGADIAASNDLTGAASLGGDWDLEVSSGTIQSGMVLQDNAIQAYEGVLADVLVQYNHGDDANANSFTATGVGNIWGQSFTATQTGTWTKLDVLVASPATVDVTLKVYSGESVAGGNLLQTITVDKSVLSTTASTYTDWSTITFATPISITSGNVYTFTFSKGSGAATYNYEGETGGSGNFGLSSGKIYGEAFGFVETHDFIFRAWQTTAGNTLPDLGGTPADDTATEDVATAIDLSAYNVSDIDGDTITLTLGVDRGTIASTDGNGTTSGVTVANSGTSSMTLQGSVANLNTYLNDTSKITYTTAANDTTTAVLSVTPNDGTGNGTADTVNITISGVNDAPTASSVPSDISVTEDTESNIDLSAMSFADPDGDSMTVTLTVSAGTFSTPSDGAGVGAGVTETLVNATTITLSGSAADINTYLDTASNIKYTPVANVSGQDQATITVSASDGNGGNLASNPSINIDVTGVNDLPTAVSDANNSSSGSSGGNFNVSFTGGDTGVTVTDTDFVITDLDDTNMESATIVLTGNSDAGETITISGTPANSNGITITYTSATQINLSGSASKAAYQTVIESIVYQNPTAASAITVGERTVTITVNDGDGNDASPPTSTISVSKPAVTSSATNDNNLNIAQITSPDSPTDNDGALDPLSPMNAEAQADVGSLLGAAGRDTGILHSLRGSLDGVLGNDLGSLGGWASDQGSEETGGNRAQNETPGAGNLRSDNGKDDEEEDPIQFGNRPSFTDQLAGAGQTQPNSLDRLVESLKQAASL